MTVQKTFSGGVVSVACGFAAAVLMSAVSVGLATAQDATLAPPAPGQAPAKPTAQKAPAVGKVTGAGPATAASGGGDAALRQRVEQLEEQIVDMQVVIGTLESLAKAPPPSPAASRTPQGPMSGADGARASIISKRN